MTGHPGGYGDMTDLSIRDTVHGLADKYGPSLARGLAKSAATQRDLAEAVHDINRFIAEALAVDEWNRQADLRKEKTP